MDLEFCVAGDQPCIPAVEQPVPEPVHQNLDAIPKSDEERDVNSTPEQPRKKAAKLEAPDICDRLCVPDDCHGSLVLVQKPWAIRALQHTGDFIRNNAAGVM